MNWYRTRSGFTIYFTALNLAANLITRAIWWPEAELLSWNVPISVLLGMLIAQPMFNINRWLKERHDQKMTELIARHEEILRVIEDARTATSEANYREATRLVNRYLASQSAEVERQP